MLEPITKPRPVAHVCSVGVQVAGCRVGVHLHPHAVLNAIPAVHPLLFEAEPDTSAAKLFLLLRSHANRREVIAAALECKHRGRRDPVAKDEQLTGGDTTQGGSPQPAVGCTDMRQLSPRPPQQVSAASPVSVQAVGPPSKQLQLLPSGNPASLVAESVPAASTSVPAISPEAPVRSDLEPSPLGSASDKAAVTQGQQVQVASSVVQCSPAAPTGSCTDATHLDAYPRCKKLLDRMHALPQYQQKTPLAVLHDHATRSALEVSVCAVCLEVPRVLRQLT